MRSTVFLTVCVAAFLICASTATARPPLKNLPAAPAAPSAQAAQAAPVTPENPGDFFGYALKFDVIGAAGGLVSGSETAVGMTVGEAVVGLSKATTATQPYETAGFWHPGILREVEVSEPAGQLAFAFMPIAPNPTVRSANISYVIPGSPGTDVEASVRVFDISGRLVRELVSGRQAPGKHSVTWDGLSSAGTQLGAGAFFVELRAGANRAVRRVILLR